MAQLRPQQSAFCRDVVRLLVWLDKQNYEFVLKEAYRDPEWQRVMFQRGKSKTLNSRHAISMAIDIALFRNIDADPELEYLQMWPQYEAAGKYWKSLNPLNVWGGDWPGLRDGNHFERTPV